MAVGSSMLATIRTAPPQWPQVLISMSKTRLRRCAQLIERRFSSGLRWSLLAPVDASSVGGRLPRPDGVSCARNYWINWVTVICPTNSLKVRPNLSFTLPLMSNPANTTISLPMSLRVV